MSDASNEDLARGATPEVFLARLVTALIQAAALYVLFESADARPPAWPANDPFLFQPALLCAWFVPAVVLIGLGQITARPLAIWTIAVTIILALIGVHYADRVAPREAMTATLAGPVGIAGALWTPAYAWIIAGLFVAQALAADSIRERKFAPSYAAHFETAWKQCFQIILALLFVGVFWGVLHLGAALFKLLALDFFQRLLGYRWFYLPATAVALAVAFHVTDARPQVTRGARTLTLTLFSWLLPLLALILGGFLGSLSFVLLQPLWNTHYATRILLTAAAVLILLVNSCYQDGAPERAGTWVKRAAIALGAIELSPLVGLAIRALWLRVDQYGWSVQRIEAAAVALVLAVYALGYAVAVVAAPKKPRGVESVNVIAAYVIVGAILALNSPLADPARLMVADQLERLRAGAVGAKDFDYAALRFEGAKWGAAALERLRETSDGPDAETIRTAAAAAERAKYRWEYKRVNDAARKAEQSPEEKLKLLRIYPEDHPLPANFAERFEAAASSCFDPFAHQNCVARFLSLEPGKPEIVILEIGAVYEVYEPTAEGSWRKSAAARALVFGCPSAQGAFQRGEIRVEAHALPDLVIGGQRFALIPSTTENCPATNK
jgi:hypothetical protein